ncbi:MAG: hypothetical protein KAR40_04830 [Candidatus Sabulitectum sp.]|nr:hypothetical protein [Candidatus Sabulitectum sp.]
MKLPIISLCLAAGLVLFSSCADSTAEKSLEISAIPEYEITLVDSFGVEMGDSLTMLGFIRDFCYHSNGSVLILDGRRKNILVLPASGSPYRISRPGSGPGEFQMCESICVLTDGRILAGDDGKHEVMIFDISGEYLGTFFNTEWYVPFKMYPVDSQAVIANLLDFAMGENGFSTSYVIGKFQRSPEADPCFLSRNWELVPAETMTRTLLTDFCADREGNVFITGNNTIYSVSIFNSAGEIIGTIERGDIARLQKTDELFDEETRLHEQQPMQDYRYNEPYAFHKLIALAGIDSEGNLWVTRFDSMPDCLFDIWSPSGELLYTARLQRTEESPELVIIKVDRGGILASTSGSADVERIYFLECNRNI